MVGCAHVCDVEFGWSGARGIACLGLWVSRWERAFDNWMVGVDGRSGGSSLIGGKQRLDPSVLKVDEAE